VRGRDLYDFNAIADSKVGASTRDVITDFDHLVDKIELMEIDADTSVAGNQAFRWVGKAALTGPGEVGFTTSGGNTILRASNDADPASELELQLSGIKALTSADFDLRPAGPARRLRPDIGRVAKDRRVIGH
jgi:hypothetical protein